MRDQHTVLSVSNCVRGAHGIEDVYFSVPAVIGRRGIERVLQLDLSAEESCRLRHSAQVMRSSTCMRSVRRPMER